MAATENRHVRSRIGTDNGVQQRSPEWGVQEQGKSYRQNAAEPINKAARPEGEIMEDNFTFGGSSGESCI